jgi:DNA-binding GntR family transcriptional regulator
MTEETHPMSRPPFRAEHVGSLLRPPELLELRHAEHSDEELRRVEDAAILEAIRRSDAAQARRAMIDHLWVLYAEVHESATAGPDGNPELAILSRDALG